MEVLEIALRASDEQEEEEEEEGEEEGRYEHSQLEGMDYYDSAEMHALRRSDPDMDMDPASPLAMMQYSMAHFTPDS
jgi:hypothetical protein